MLGFHGLLSARDSSPENQQLYPWTLFNTTTANTHYNRRRARSYLPLWVQWVSTWVWRSDDSLVKYSGVLRERRVDPNTVMQPRYYVYSELVFCWLIVHVSQPCLGFRLCNKNTSFARDWDVLYQTLSSSFFSGMFPSVSHRHLVTAPFTHYWDVLTTRAKETRECQHWREFSSQCSAVLFSRTDLLCNRGAHCWVFHLRRFTQSTPVPVRADT